ncbi:hypothetical protein PIB30_047338 [Stylosanthes scabra]|uniref:Uncharacterized protein n=1 Tax=Stylosanthes scabra TaxID=79078 RepID=A0ABU6SGX7_9FABA|nr:hypothetical protein [Stylosanthes scabra]
MSQAASYKTSRDHRLDPSPSAFVASPHQPYGMGYTVSDFADTPAQYGTPPAYYDFLSGPSPTATQAEAAAHEPSPPPPPQRPARTVRPPPCGTEHGLRLILEVRGIGTLSSRVTKLVAQTTSLFWPLNEVHFVSNSSGNWSPRDLPPHRRVGPHSRPVPLRPEPLIRDRWKINLIHLFPCRHTVHRMHIRSPLYTNCSTSGNDMPTRTMELLETTAVTRSLPQPHPVHCLMRPHYRNHLIHNKNSRPMIAAGHTHLRQVILVLLDLRKQKLGPNITRSYLGMCLVALPNP